MSDRIALVDDDQNICGILIGGFDFSLMCRKLSGLCVTVITLGGAFYLTRPETCRIYDIGILYLARLFGISTAGYPHVAHHTLDR